MTILVARKMRVRIVAGGIAPDLRASPVLMSGDAFAHVVRDGALSARGMRQKARNDLNKAHVID